MRPAAGALGAGLLLGGLAQAEAPPPIVGGARTQAHPAVGALVAYDASRGGASFCSGTLIDARWVVTAAHCLEAMNQYRTQGFDLVVVFGDDIFTEAGIIDAVYASSWTLHPDYGGEAVLPPVADVGVVRLDRAARDVEALPMNTDAPSSRWLDAELTLVGWGLTGIYIVDEGWVGVETRFGERTIVTQAGPHWHIPYPIEDVEKIDVVESWWRRRVRCRGVHFRHRSKRERVFFAPLLGKE